MKGLLLPCLIFVCLVLAVINLNVVVVGVIVVIVSSLKSYQYSVGLCIFGQDRDMDFMQECHSVRMVSFVMILPEYKTELRFCHFKGFSFVIQN